MGIANNLYVRAANDFVHDLSAGAFPGAVIGTLLLKSRLAVASPESIEFLGRATSALWSVFFVAVALLIATGAFRLRYWRLNVRQGYLEKKSRTVWIKHLGFVAVMVASLVQLFRLLAA